MFFVDRYSVDRKAVRDVRDADATLLRYGGIADETFPAVSGHRPAMVRPSRRRVRSIRVIDQQASQDL
jgi:hypothetical protein